jgi:uncharacterized membrane protein
MVTFADTGRTDASTEDGVGHLHRGAVGVEVPGATSTRTRRRIRRITGAVNKTRVEAVSDGIFAIAITLLVLTIAQPQHYSGLGDDLLSRWPALAAYVVSFAVIGIMWFNHHSVFAQLERIDRRLFFLNLLLLMTVAFLPYPTGVLGEALHLGQGARTAALVYSATMAVNAFAWGALWIYAAHDRRLLRAAFPEGERRRSTVLFTLGVIPYTVSVGIALLNAYACLAFHAALAMYYALDPLSRRVAATPVTDDD